MSGWREVLDNQRSWAILEGDCLAVLRGMPDGCVASVVTDPPYALVEPNSARSSYAARMRDGRTDEDKAARKGGFMGKKWDGALPDPVVWAECLRVLRPGGYLLAFGGTRTWHRLACHIEDAGFLMRDTLCWLYGSGFPKGQGCLKPAWEPILLCRKPGPRVKPLQVDACRVGTTREVPGGRTSNTRGVYGGFTGARDEGEAHDRNIGRYPANVVHDGSEEVLEAFAAFGDRPTSNGRLASKASIGYGGSGEGPDGIGYGDTGTAARFFYCAKADGEERGDSTHPTMKPVVLMDWLVRLVTPPGGVVLDPFAGSGSTLVACQRRGFPCVGIEREEEYAAHARRRLSGDMPLFNGGAP